MRRYFLQTSGMAVLTLLLQTNAHAQQTGTADTDSIPGPARFQKELIIRPKADKDVKLTVEIKDGKVLINGKPAASTDDAKIYADTNIVIYTEPLIRVQGLSGNGITLYQSPETFDMVTPGPPPFPEANMGPGNLRVRRDSFTLRGNTIRDNPNRVFLGVSSVKPSEEGAAGAQVSAVSKESAAEKAGLKEGDIITRLDATDIAGPEALTRTVHKYKVGDKVKVTYLRDGKEKKQTLVLGKAPATTTFHYDYDFNMQDMDKMDALRNMTIDLHDLKALPPGPYGPHAFAWGDAHPRLGIKAQDTDEGKGAKVLKIADESPAEKAGIAEGDVITRFDGKDINNATDLAAAARAARDKADIRVNLTRNGKPLEIAIKIPKDLKTTDL